MHLDFKAEASTWTEAAALAARLEAGGFAGILYTEGAQVPWMMIASAAQAAERLVFSTGIAVAFPRSPMVSAQIGWELARNTAGRFRLGLGSQVKAHDHGHLPVDISAVGPYMTQVAGEVADGVHVHPMHSLHYIDNRLLPALEKGASKSGRSTNDIDLIIPVFAIPGDSPEERAALVRRAKIQIGFYGSTPNYAFQFDDLGFGHVTPELRTALRAGDNDRMEALITDEILDHFAVVGTWDDMADQLLGRYRDVATRVVSYLTSPQIKEDPGTFGKWCEIARAVGAG